MKKTGKILLTDIRADRNREEALIKYLRLMAAGFENYATIKMSMNLFTLYEMSEEISLDRRDEIENYLDTLNMALRTIYVDKKGADEELINDISGIREKITKSMQTLTYYTDALEIYEYILNRREPEILGTTDEELDTEQLANDMFNFVFAEKDKMIVNTRIQDFIAQLPVRMTKTRFYDIISNSLSIYRGGEQKAVDDFVESIRDASLMKLDTDISDEYPKLAELYEKISKADYKQLDRAGFDEIADMITEATGIIQEAVTDYLMLTEIINDVLIVLYTDSFSDKSFLGKEYNTASGIIGEIVVADDIYQASDRFDNLFAELEGSQEAAYEELVSLEANLEQLSGEYYDVYDSESIRSYFDNLFKADMLTSTSLFMDIDGVTPDIRVVNEEADEIYIEETKNSLVQDFDELFTRLNKLEKRSVMAKVLSLMPVFFNSQQEILEYFQYALSSCTDKGELTALRDIVGDMIY